jgi:hypothetical protein
MVGRAATVHLGSGTLPNSPMLPEPRDLDKSADNVITIGQRRADAP